MANSAPNAPSILSPTGSGTIDYAIAQLLSWIFSDPDVGDTQSQFDIQYRIVGAGAWTTITVATPNNFYSMPAGTFSANNYEWQVRTYDQLGVVGPWCASSFFTAATVPAVPTITAPTSGATVSAAPTFTWSAPAQASYQIRKVRDVAGLPDTSTIYYDTGEVVDIPTRSVILSMPTNSRYEHLQLRIKNAGVWSAWVSVRVLVSYIQPSPGTLAVVGNDATGSIVITTTAAVVGGGEPTPIYVDIYIKVFGTPGFGDCLASHLAPSGTWTWFAPAHGVVYEVRSLTTADNGTQRWSSAVFVHVIDGGSAVAPAWTVFLDGGTPTTVFTNAIDGGAP